MGFTWDGKNEPTVFTDQIGQDIRVGDFICYAVSYGSSAGLIFAKVEGFRTRGYDGELYLRNVYNAQTGKREPKHFYKLRVVPVGRTKRVHLENSTTIIKIAKEVGEKL